MTDTPIAALLQPLAIRALEVKNRIVMAPMTRSHSPDRVPGPDVAGYYRRRAENHVGLIITEGVGIDEPAAVDMRGVPVLYGDAALRGWTEVVRQVHEAGGKLVPQLWHQGALRDAAISDCSDIGPLRPSAGVGPWGKVSLEADKVARLSAEVAPMTDSQIADVISAYARSAANAVRVGFDGIAIHAGHGYLIDNFLWHGSNIRTDRWGKDRSLFAAEVVRAIRKAIGEDLPIIFRFSQFRMQDYQATLADTPAGLERLLGPIADAGVDVFDGSQRYFDTPTFAGSPLNLGGWAKRLTGKLGMCVGGVGLDQGKRDHHIDSGSGAANNLGLLVERFDRGEFDLVGIGRSLLNDPSWLTRAIDGEPFLPFDSANLERLT